MRDLLHKLAKPFGPDEAWLQRYLANHPELLPLRDLEGIEAIPRLIGRELLGIDLLFADDRGLLTVVETKLVENPELKRRVVAQVLEYGAALNKLDVPELCTAITRTRDSPQTREVPKLYELAQGLASCGLLNTKVNESERSAAENMLARYVLTGKIEQVKGPSNAESAFLSKLDTMLGFGSFRLAIVAYETPRGLLDLVNYANTVMRQGHQIVIAELSVADLADGTYFVPHLVGAPGLMHPAYYREERIAERLYQDWQWDDFREALPADLGEDVGLLIEALEQRRDTLGYRFGSGRIGSLIVGARIEGPDKDANNVFTIWTDGSVTFYYVFAAPFPGDSPRWSMPEQQREQLHRIIQARSWLADCYQVILAGLKQSKRKMAEPKFKLRSCGRPGERWKAVLDFLEEYWRVVGAKAEPSSG